MWIVLKEKVKTIATDKRAKPNNNNKQENRPPQPKSEVEQVSKPRQKQEAENTAKTAPQEKKAK
jgi:hypothetical protein